MFQLFNPVYLAGLAFVGVITTIIFSRWRLGLVFVFVWIFFEDILRRFIPGEPVAIQLVKDYLLFVTYFAFSLQYAITGWSTIWKPPFILGLVLFLAWCIIEVFNPIISNPLIGIIGLRSYLWYTPVIFLGYYMFNKKHDLLKFCRVLIYTGIPLVVIAILQWIFPDFLPPLREAWGFHYSGFETVRLIPSVFGTGPRYASVCLILFFCGLGLIIENWQNTVKKNPLLTISTCCALLGIVISGSRTPMLWALIGLIWFFLVINNRSFSLSKAIKQRTKIVLIFMCSIFFILLFSIPKALPFFMNAITIDLDQRSKEMLAQIGYYLLQDPRGFWGYGTGIVSQGVFTIPGMVDWWTSLGHSVGAEFGLIKIWFELGLVGVLIFIFFCLAMFFSWRKAAISVRGTSLGPMGQALFIYFVMMGLWFFKGHQIFGDATTLVLFWFFMGVLSRLKYLTNREAIRDRENG